jgi:hypothetical protein
LFDSSEEITVDECQDVTSPIQKDAVYTCGAQKKINVAEYRKFMSSNSIEAIKTKCIGKKLYAIQDNVNVRTYPYVDNAYIDNLEWSGIPKGTYLGKILDVVYDSQASNSLTKPKWFRLNRQLFENQMESFNIGNDETVVYHISSEIYVYVREDVVVVDFKS